MIISFFFFFSSRRRHTRYWRDWSSDVCSSDLGALIAPDGRVEREDRPVGAQGVNVVRRAERARISVTKAPCAPVWRRIGRSEERRVGKECRAGGWAEY